MNPTARWRPHWSRPGDLDPELAAEPVNLVFCPEHDGWVPVVNYGGFYTQQVALHYTGPLVEITRGYWRRLPCWGSRRIVETREDGSRVVRPVWWTDR
jgi:hypothetical protein